MSSTMGTEHEASVPAFVVAIISSITTAFVVTIVGSAAGILIVTFLTRGAVYYFFNIWPRQQREMDTKASLDRLSTLPQEILLNICSHFCQCCREEICKYTLDPQGNFGPDWYLLPGKKSDARALSDLSLTSRSLRIAAQEVLHHAPYVEGAPSVVKLCRTVVKRRDLGIAIRVLPVWDFGGLDAVAEQSAVKPMVDLLEENYIGVTPKLLRKRQRSKLARRADEVYMAATKLLLPLQGKPIPSFLPAYAMDMIVGMAKRARCFYGAQAIRAFPDVALPRLKPLINLRECYLFLGGEDPESGGEDFRDNHTYKKYDKMLPALFGDCPQLSILGLEVDLGTLGAVLEESAFKARDNSIPIQRLEIRILETPHFISEWSEDVGVTLMDWLVHYFAHASNLSEMYWILLARHSHTPTTPATEDFSALLPILGDLTETMIDFKTTALKNRIRRLAFLNPNLTYGDWDVRPEDHRMDSAMAAEARQGTSSFRNFPNLEVLDISAHFAYISAALHTLPGSIKELRIHDSVPNVSLLLEEEIFELLFFGPETDIDGVFDEPPVVFANPCHARRALALCAAILDRVHEENDEQDDDEDDEEGQKEDYEVINPCHNGLISRTNAQLEEDLRDLL